MEPTPPALDVHERLDIDRELTRAGVALALFHEPAPVFRLGRFHLLRPLGVGGMGAVYEAFDTSRHGRVALKLLRRSDPLAVAQLKREFRSLSHVTHPNLVVLHELFIQQSRLFFTMDLVQGEPFDRFVRPGDRLDEARLRDALLQLAAAITAIHAAGKLHGDLKPRNVLATQAGRVVALDFGLVGELESAAESSSARPVMGTPAYIAPEQVSGGAASEAQDWYAVGVMLFEAMTGRLPFDGPPPRVLRDKQQRVAPDPREWAPELPAELSELCLALLRRDAARRATGEDVLRVLVPLPANDALGSARHSWLARRNSEFVGREQELSQLERALAKVRGGEGANVFLPGPSGMGKSALLERFAQLCGDGVLVLRGRCFEHESVPYKALDGVMDDLGLRLQQLRELGALPALPAHWSALRRLFPALSELPTPGSDGANPPRAENAIELRMQGVAALKGLLIELGKRQPIALLIDDLQWGDLDSARMLASVFSPPDAPAVLLVGAYRSEAQDSEFLRVLSEAPSLPAHLGPSSIELGPLGLEDATALARVALGERAEHTNETAIARRIAVDCEGAPFLITELAWNVRGGGGQIEHAGIPSLEAMLRARIAQLGNGSQRLIEVLSVAGAPIEQVVALEAADLPLGDRGAFFALRNARLLRSRGAGVSDLVETYHDRVRETVACGLSEPTLRATHGRIAQAMQRHAIVEAERLIVHYLGAGDRVRAGQAALAAAERTARKLAFHRTAELLAQAIELLPEAEVRDRELYRQLGDAQANAGQGERAAEAYLRAARDLDALPALRMRRLAAAQYFESGQLAAAHGLTREVLRAYGIELPTSRVRMQMALVWHYVRLKLRGLELTRGTQVSREGLERSTALSDIGQRASLLDARLGALLHLRHLREALDSGDPEDAQYALTMHCVGIALMGGARNERSALAIAARIRALGQEVGTSRAEAWSHMAECYRLLATGRHFEDARVEAAATQRLLVLAACPGTFWEKALTMQAELACLRLTGSLTEHATLAQACLQDATARGDVAMVVPAQIAIAYGMLAQGDAGAALDYLASRRPAASAPSDAMRLWLDLATATLSYLGRGAEALTLLRAYWPELRRSATYGYELGRQALHYIYARCALGAYAETRDRRLVPMVLKLTPPSHRQTSGTATYLALRASLHAAEGEIDRACALLEQSSATMRACQATLPALYSDRHLLRLRGDQEGLARIDAELTRNGIADPARWVNACYPLVDPSVRPATKRDIRRWFNRH